MENTNIAETIQRLIELILELDKDKGESGLIDKIFPIVYIFIGSGITWFLTKRERDNQRDYQENFQRVSNTFEMAKEWDGESMLGTRCKADKDFVQDHSNNSISFISIYQNNYEKSLSISRIVAFYERLDLLRSQNRIDEDLVIKLFSKDYTWWYKNYFESQIKNLKNDKDWNTFIVKHEWLLNEETQSAS